jgi:hypothetical protein
MDAPVQILGISWHFGSQANYTEISVNPSFVLLLQQGWI